MDLYLNLMPDLRDVVFEYFGDVIFSQSSDFSQAQDEVNEVTFATAEEFKKSKAIDCYFINYEITSTDHTNKPDIPKTLLRCSGVPKIKTHTLAFMFYLSKFNGDLSQWDVSSVTDMRRMFAYSQFIGDISQWDVSSINNMHEMFCNSQFNGDLSQWDVANVTNMSIMFGGSKFNNPSLLAWDVSKVTNMYCMFTCARFNGEISQWDVSSVTNMRAMFRFSKIKKETVQAWHNFKNHNIDEMF